MLKEIIESLADRTDLPIEISEIADIIIAGQFQDEIYFLPIDCDPAELRGIYSQFRYSNGVYQEPQWVTQIGYSASLTVEWQRVICAKELVHIFDRDEARTDTPEEVDGLLEKLVGPLTSEDYGMADLSAAKDRIALYQALPLLFPWSCLEQAKPLIADGTVSVEQVADWAKIPLVFVQLMLSDEWIKHRDILAVA